MRNKVRRRPGEPPDGRCRHSGGSQTCRCRRVEKNAEYRQKIREYYEKNGLLQPQRIVGELQSSRILRAVYSERQLQEVMVDFWTNHFNVFAGKGADRWLLTSYDRDTIRPNAMGKFYDLLRATAQSPAMLFYLDNFQSVSPNAQRGLNGNGAARRSVAIPCCDLLRGPCERHPQLVAQQAGNQTAESATATSHRDAASTKTMRAS